MEPWQLMLFALAVVAIGYSLWQGSRIRRRLQGGNALSESLEEVRELENSARGIAQKLEVRAYDYSREVEARIDNRLAVLDQLILDADREIERLQTLLAESKESVEQDERKLTPAEQQRCFALKEAGLAVDEIARCLKVSSHSVQQSLDEWQRPEQRAA